MGYRESISSDSPSAQNWLLDPKTNEQSPKIDPQRQYSTPSDQKSTSKNLNRTPEVKIIQKWLWDAKITPTGLKSTPKAQN